MAARAVAYFDESIRENLQVVAGFVAPESLWAEVIEPAWKTVLAEACDANGHVDEYKASDCEGGGHQFRSWTWHARRVFRDKLAGVLVDACATRELVGVAVAYELPGLVEPEHPKATRFRRDIGRHAYEVCTSVCLTEFFDLGLSTQRFSELLPVFDKRAGFVAVLQKGFGTVRDQLAPEADAALLPPEMLCSKSCVRLQTADMLAYLVQEEYWRRPTGVPVVGCRKTPSGLTG